MSNSAPNTPPRHDSAPNKAHAINTLIRLTQNLTQLAEREAQALAKNDMLTFSILQDEKALVTERYTQASHDFAHNINLYRGADQGLLNRLERLQHDLSEKTRDNNEAVTKMYSRLQPASQSTLISAQLAANENDAHTSEEGL